ncbi:MAG: hypothetical protein RMN51_07165 [Verrucomicrobiota bacterium]|nr:hypothetical protein [Limisphaera sp.]MDW8381871.1 hypothetical protein [Verrucomicrobiota bacterium]
MTRGIHGGPVGLQTGCLGLLVGFLVLGAGMAGGQTVHFRTVQLRQTIPVGSSGSVVWSNYAVLTGVTQPVLVSVEGLPVGVSAQVDPQTLTASGPVVITLDWANVPEGEHVFRLVGRGGAANELPLRLQVAHLWNGADGVQGFWSAPSNWVGGQVPPEGADVVFTDLGGQTAAFTNVIVDGDVTVGSIRFSTTNATRYYTLEIPSGRTLHVLGPLGLRLMRDYVEDNSAGGWLWLGNGPMVSVVGGGGRLVVSNPTAPVAVVVGAQIPHTLDLSGLGTFIADVHRLGFGDYSMMPEYHALLANGYNGIPRRFIPTVYLARTNILVARYRNPDNYENSATRFFAFSYLNSVLSGTTQIRDFYLGVTNAFMMESIVWVGANQQGRVQFNPAFSNLNPIAVFRNVDGGRMKVFAVSDESGTNAGSSNIKSWLYFGNNNGIVDILADLFYISRDRPFITSDPNFQGEMYVGRGIVDVNRAVLGFQDGGSRTNTGVYRGWCQATLVISNTAVLRVNDVLELGYTTETNPGGEPWNTRGRLFIGPGGTAMINRVEVGGVSKLSGDNVIAVTNGAHLILTNTIASPEKTLARFIMANGRLTLHIDGTRAEPYLYVSNLVASGTGNRIRLARIENLSSYPAQLALIRYFSATANFSLELPDGYFGYLLDDSSTKTIVAVVTTNPPPQVVWNGTVNGNWDTTTLNWQGGSRFLNGAPVVFDDTAAGTTTITIVDSVAPGGMIVSNVTKTYTFTGGQIAGTALMVKQGSGLTVMDAPSQLPLDLQAGTVQGSGTLGPTTVASGANLNFSGLINGLITSGTVVSSGTIENGLTVMGGSFQSSGTISGPVTIAGGTALITGTVNASGTSTVDPGATLILDGRFNNREARLNVNGILRGNGVVSDPDGYNLGVDGRLSVNSGGILSPGRSLGVLSVEGRFDLNPGARLVIEVDLNHPARNDRVAVDVFGNIRGIITMTNIGSVPFAVGQSFVIVSNNFNLANTPLNPNLDFQFDPPSPGPGMRWDGTDLATNGIVRIVAAPLEPPRIAVQWNAGEVVLEWPQSHVGWILQRQVRSLAEGLSLNPGDWEMVVGSPSTNRFTVPMAAEPGAVFYRLVQP